MPRGKGLGGSSTINAMIYCRGNLADFSAWAQSGLREYSYERMLPYFQRSETWGGENGRTLGSDGPLPVNEQVERAILADTFLAAAAAEGFTTGHLPEGAVNIVTGYGHVAGQALVDHPGVDKISFTGSTATGKTLVAACTGNLHRISLELGANRR